VALTVLGILAAYLIGAIPVGFLVARAAGSADIRRAGSGSIGATNVLRTLGVLPAVLTLVGDVVKGYLAVTAARAIGTEAWAAAAGAVAAVTGNCWPVFLAFRGGKGVATGLGAFLALIPWAIAPAAALWIVVTAISRYVSLASIVACVSLPVSAALLGYPRHAVIAAVVTAAIIIWRHRKNIARLASGSESRLGERARTA
jgi:acyl phosphate:glycerol-3-phosphate acyltransferase